MPTGNSFISPQTPKEWTAVAVTGETAFNNPTNMVTLVDESADTSQKRITSLYAITRGTQAGNNNCQLYKKVGSTYTLIDSALMIAVTPSATAANGKIDFGYSEDTPLILSAGTGLAVAIGTTTANGVVFKAHGGTY